jgi:hypothetical protein
MVILALTDPTYQPAMRIIDAITNADPASITTTFDHDYVTGTIVRIVVPLGFGMQQINQMVGTITVTGNTTFTIDIDTSWFDSFAAPVVFPFNQQYAQVVPIGEINETLLIATKNVL